MVSDKEVASHNFRDVSQISRYVIPQDTRKCRIPKHTSSLYLFTGQGVHTDLLTEHHYVL